MASAGRRAPDPARVEERGAIAVAEAEAIFEQLLAFQEEAPLLVEEDLGGAEVEHARIALDLAEVRVDRERQVHRCAQPEARFAAQRSGEAGIVVVELDASQTIRLQRQRPARGQLLQTLQRGEVTDQRGGAARGRAEVALLAQPRQVPSDLEP